MTSHTHGVHLYLNATIEHLSKTSSDITILRDVWCEWSFFTLQYYTGFCFFGISDDTKSITSTALRAAKSWPFHKASNNIIIFNLLANRPCEVGTLLSLLRDPLTNAIDAADLKQRILANILFVLYRLNQLIEKQGLRSHITPEQFMSAIYVFVQMANNVDYNNKEAKDAQIELGKFYRFTDCFDQGTPKNSMIFLDKFLTSNYDQHQTLTPEGRIRVIIWTKRYIDHIYGVPMPPRVVPMDPHFQTTEINNLVHVLRKEAVKFGVTEPEAICQFIFDRWAELALVACYYYCGFCFLGVSREMTRMSFVNIHQRYPEGYFDGKTELTIMLYKLRLTMTSLSPLISRLYFTDLNTTRIDEVSLVLDTHLPEACKELALLLDTVGEPDQVRVAEFLGIMLRMAYAVPKTQNIADATKAYAQLGSLLTIAKDVPLLDFLGPFSLWTVEKLTQLNCDTSRQFSMTEKRNIRELSRALIDVALERNYSQRTESKYLMFNRGVNMTTRNSQYQTNPPTSPPPAPPRTQDDPTVQRMMDFLFK